MADYTTGRQANYIFRRVDFDTRQEREDVEGITGGSLEFSALTDTKCSGTLQFVGDVPDVNELIRIYYTFTDDYGESEQVPLCTMIAQCEAPDKAPDRISGEIELLSLLDLIMRFCVGTPLVVPAGTNIVSYVDNFIKNWFNLATNGAECEKELSADYISDEGASALTICNELLDRAGYSSLCVDAYGTIILKPYIEPTKRPVVYTFSDTDANAIFQPSINHELNLAEYNMVRLRFSGDEYIGMAIASNVDADSPSSTVNRGGYDYVLSDSISLSDDFEGAKNTEDANAPYWEDGDRSADVAIWAKEQARTKLLDNCMDIERITINHAYVPIEVDDAICVDYYSAGVFYEGTIISMSMTLDAELSCTTQLRHFVHPDIDIYTDAVVIQRSAISEDLDNYYATLSSWTLRGTTKGV